ncbi:Hypothetical predicted protein [Mytilus galloprovincialis]|uniref:VWFA domain-containing protein n=1 Tax=Mytilus galloprovincialis TaxID=29158 RepID=A0A8B6C485_MYTGA|nr:Hypothetical predicted protein [Mytilus galloprovincialis]
MKIVMKPLQYIKDLRYLHTAVKLLQNLKETCHRLLRDIPNIRIGIIAHGDFCDNHNYVIKIQDLTSDVQKLVDFAAGTPATGGGDTPECYELVLQKAQQLDWTEDSAKALVVIGDCEPHPPSYTDQKINWHDELNALKAMEVKAVAFGVEVYNIQIHKYVLTTNKKKPEE